RVPSSEGFRYQTGFNLDVTDGLQLFGEAKFVRELTNQATSPTFFQTVIADVRPGERPGSFLLLSSALINIGLDNAYLNQNAPELVAAVRANRRPVVNAAGVQTGTVLDPRAFLTAQGPTRTQNNERELTRYVAGVRGDFDRVAFIDNFAYEIGYTYGEVENRNREAAVDIERFQFSVDAVRDVNNVTGRGANAIVCRIQLLTAGGRTIPDEIRGGSRTLDANSPQVRDCVPTNIFGADLRADAGNENATGGGGRPGLTPEQRAYIGAAINVLNTNQQQNLLAFASGEILDGVLPAGPIGIAVGYEYREEKTSGIGRSAETGDRRLFLNTGPDFPEVSYDANEVFTEVRVPLLRDLPLVETLEVSGAYRTSEYSTVGKVDTRSLQGLYRPNRTFLFRTTYGEATRIPNLGENFAPGTQTFANGFVDPCDANVIRGIANPQDRANRRTNCQALLGPGYSPGTDAPNTGTSIIYTSGVPGRNAGNPFLIPEDSRSYTYGVAFTPRFIRGLSLTADYFDIKINNVIAAVAAQAAAINCVAGTTLNPQACATIFRTGATPPPGTGASPFAVTDFIQGSLNFAALEAKGIDFTGRYAVDLADLGVPTIFGRAPGRLDYSIRGTYLIRRENFLNFADPGDAEELDAQVGFPRVRFLSTLIYSPTDRFSVSWNWDYQSSQEILDSDVFRFNGDTRDARFAETGAYSTHSFNARYEITENFLIRAGVVNAFDNDPPVALGSNTSADNFDFFGRRFFIGGNLKLGAVARR
ncbi:MAG: TonB-dependent receptor, partial [Proteobacteria bacterium]|nr:TonB-dependent receptor [Pseudomonadota bacterium]